MSDDPELERRLDAMFGSLRPRPQFADGLRERLRARRPWWNRPALLWLAAAIPLLLLAIFAVPQLSRHGGGTRTSSFQTAGSSHSTVGAALARQPACASPGALAAVQAGKTAPPPAADSPSPSPCP